MPSWNPEQYLQFAKLRTRACLELVNRIPGGPRRIIADLGCGPGSSTQVIQGVFPDARITGYDNSHDMLARARKDCPDLRFEFADAGSWTASEPCDLILANAVFHWVPEHETLFPRLISQLSDAGVLAVQMPSNLDAPTTLLMNRIAEEGPWASRLAASDPNHVSPAEFYYDVLAPVASTIDIWETQYQQVMNDHEAIVEWGKGAGLRAFLDPLNESEQKVFLARYVEGIRALYPIQRDGRVLFPFRRLFIVATR